MRSFNYNECIQDITTLSKYLSRDCEHSIGPTSIRDSIQIPASLLSNTNFESHASTLLNFLQAYTLELKEMTVDEIQRKVVVQAIHHATLKAEYGSDSCSIETSITLWMSRDGRTIEKVSHFFDSLSATKFYEEQSWVSSRTETDDPG